MRKRTTAKQRQLWADIHWNLMGYILEYGPIEIEQNGKITVLNADCRFIECGKLYNEREVENEL